MRFVILKSAVCVNRCIHINLKLLEQSGHFLQNGKLVYCLCIWRDNQVLTDSFCQNRVLCYIIGSMHISKLIVIYNKVLFVEIIQNSARQKWEVSNENQELLAWHHPHIWQRSHLTQLSGTANDTSKTILEY